MTAGLGLWHGGTVHQRETVAVREATEADIEAITAIAKATGQDEDWTTVYPSYVRHLIEHGRFLVGSRDGVVTGFGGTRLIGTGPLAITMLTDLFVDPAAHGTGTGRAILADLWAGQPRKMTFSSLHSNALPLYTSFGVDAWWPLLYLGGQASRLAMPAGWSVSPASPGEVAALELAWTGIDRASDHEMWAARPAGIGLVASRDGRPVAAGTGGGVGPEYGISHLAVDPAAVRAGAAGPAAGDGAESGHAADALIAALASLDPPDGRAHVCLPAPHPAVRPLLAAGWKVSEFDLYMASEPGLVDPRRLVPSPALA